MTISTHFHRFLILLFSIGLFFMLTAGQCPPHQKPHIADEPCQVLVLKNGEHLSIRNLMVLEKSIKYQKCDTLDKAFYEKKKAEVFLVERADGKKLYKEHLATASKTLPNAPNAYKVSVVFASIAILSLLMFFFVGPILGISFIIGALVGGISYLIGNSQIKNHVERFDAKQIQKWRKVATILNGTIWIPIAIIATIATSRPTVIYYYW